MGKTTGISWCDHTFNPWWGCFGVSPACDACYAEAWDHRLGGDHFGVHKPLRYFGDDHWRGPLKWDKSAAHNGVRRKVFCGSMCDVFDNRADRNVRKRLWRLIKDTPNLDWLMTTKRVGNVEHMLPPDWSIANYPNVWLIITVANQAEADRDIPKAVALPFARRGLSIEPQLGAVNLARWLSIRSNEMTAALDAGAADWPGCGQAMAASDAGLHWIIAGGESEQPNHEPRPMHPAWPDILLGQCQDSQTAFHFKQWGAWMPETAAKARRLKIHETRIVRFDEKSPGGVAMARVGRDSAGRELDGRERLGFPDPHPLAIAAAAAANEARELAKQPQSPLL